VSLNKNSEVAFIVHYDERLSTAAVVFQGILLPQSQTLHKLFLYQGPTASNQDIFS